MKKRKRKKLSITLPETLIDKVEELEENTLINKSKLIEKLLNDHIRLNTK